MFCTKGSQLHEITSFIEETGGREKKKKKSELENKKNKTTF